MEPIKSTPTTQRGMTPRPSISPVSPISPTHPHETPPPLEGNGQPTATEGFEATIVRLDHTSAEQLFRKARL